MERIHLLRNPQSLQKIYAYCTNVAEKLGDHQALREAKINLERYSDSVKQQNTDLGHLKAKMVISSVNANIAVENMKLVVSSGQQVIERQNAVIQFLLLVLGIIGLIGVAFWIYRWRFKPTNRKLEAKTMRLVQRNLDESYTSGREISIRPGIECLTGKLEALNQTQRPYLNPDLTLDELAAMLGTNHTYLSAFINQHYSVNFNEYLNGLRVDYACALLMSEDPLLSNDQILERSGFHSRSTFYAAFKKHMGVTPAAFLKIEHEVKKTAL
jgi:AraC-like DNA-binding protein